MTGPVDQPTVSLGGPRQRAVLVDLLIHANEVLTPAHIINDVWEGEPPPGAATTLKVYVSHLRQALTGVVATLATRRPGYILEVDPSLIDTVQFEALAAEGARLVSSDPAAASTVLAAALGLWRGAPLSEVADLDFARPTVTRLQELRLSALERRIEADLLRGLDAELIGELEALVETNPFHEGFWALLMRALSAAGRRAEALRAYQRLRRTLGEGLGIEPSLALQQLEQSVLLEDLHQTPEASSRQSNLPLPGTSFVGRTAELADLEGLLGQHRLVTVVGEGGSGKTRLAVEVARRIAGASAATGPGPWLVELAPATSDEHALRIFATAVGAMELPGQAPLDGIADALGADDVLVVLDNCEHLIEEVALPVSQLLNRCPNLRILATSREGLGVAGEVQWRIPTLATPPADVESSASAVIRFDSVRLLVERATAADPLFALTDDRVPAVGIICRRLDGMPLALELAAARLRVLSLEEVAARLDDRFRLLAGAGGRGTVARQRSLQAAVEWSYELLSPDERLLFQRLSVFAGLFSLEHVEAICSGGGIDQGEVMDLVGNLVAKSLVVRLPRATGAARFRLLETLYEYARERLGEGAEADAVRSKHAAWYLARGEEVSANRFGQGWRRWLERLEEEHDDCRAALSWLIEQGDADRALRMATALWRFWDYHYLTEEGRGWLDRALALVGGTSDVRRRALAGSAYLGWMDDDLAGADTRCQEGLALPNGDEDPAGVAALLAIRSEVGRHRGAAAEETEKLSLQAAELFHRAGDEWGEADALRVLTLLASDRGDLQRAFEFGERCLLLWDRCGGLEKSAGARSLLAGVARDSGNLVQAQSLYEESLMQFRQAGEPWGTAQITWSLGRVVLARGEYERAYRFGQECLAMNTQLANRRGIAEANQLIADAALELGRTDDASRHCNEALEAFRARGFEPDTRGALISAAWIALAAGDPGRGAAMAEEAGEDRAALCLLGVSLARLSRLDEARAALARAGGAPSPSRAIDAARIEAWLLEARAELDLGDPDELLEQARERRQAAGAVLAPSEEANRQRVLAAASHRVTGGREELVIDLRDAERHARHSSR